MVRLGPLVCRSHQRKPKNWNIRRKKITAVNVAYTVHLTDPRKQWLRKTVAQKLWQALTALPIGPPEALRTSSLMSVN